MDETDRRIAEFLSQDGRASNRAIADALGLSPRLVGARIDSMLERRELRIAAIADIFGAGNDLLLAVGVSVLGRPTLEVAEELAALDEVCAVNIVSGEFDIEVLILSADHDRVRTVLVQHAASAPNDLGWGVDLAPGLEQLASGENQTSLVDADGYERLKFEPAVVVDAAGLVSKAGIALDADGIARLHLDPKRDAATYPITIDFDLSAPPFQLMAAPPERKLPTICAVTSTG